MNNLSKNLLLGLTFVCVIVLIVFCIQLIVINSGVDRGQPGSISGGSGQNAGEEGVDPPGSEEGSGEEGGTGSGAGGADVPRPPPQGLRRELIISDTSRLIVYAREETFSFVEADLNWWFNFTGGGTASLDITFMMLTSAQGINEQAEAFLNRYSGGTEAVFTGEQAIQGSVLRGYHVSSRAGSETYEAWIHDLIDSDIAVAFVIKYDNEQQKEALYEVLSSMEIIRLGDNITPPPGHGTDPGTGLEPGGAEDPGSEDPGGD